jgi:hypothetical protein
MRGVRGGHERGQIGARGGLLHYIGYTGYIWVKLHSIWVMYGLCCIGYGLYVGFIALYMDYIAFVSECGMLVWVIFARTAQSLQPFSMTNHVALYCMICGLYVGYIALYM